ncbi:ATP-binding cassette domain-containing protein [bacterium]|nr:ATP-binding cassette domain-containing protein [bacterium]
MRVDYGAQFALKDMSLKVEAGECLALLGPSGAGKSTLLSLLGGRRFASSGEVHAGDRALDTLQAKALQRLRSRIGFIEQDHHLVPNLRVSQNVLAGRLGRLSFSASLRRMLRPPRHELEKVLSILDRVGVGEKIFTRSDRLSGGERQRVAIARALYQDPGALLADEPVASVDPARARDTIELLTRLAEEYGFTLIVSLHNLELAREYFPRLVGIREGGVVFDQASLTLSDADFQALYNLKVTSFES